MQPVLLYDADCGFCTRTAGWLRRHGLRADLAPIGGAGTAHLGVDLDRARHEVPFVDNAGRVSYGADAGQSRRFGTVPPPVLPRRLASPGLPGCYSIRASTPSSSLPTDTVSRAAARPAR